MILNGQAKEDFIVWCKKQNDLSLGIQIPNTTGGVIFYLNSNPEILPEKILNALIIEWLDIVGIFIQDWGFIYDVDNVHAGFDVSVAYKGRLYQDFQFQKSRQKAIEKAIKKANEIYNNARS